MNLSFPKSYCVFDFETTDLDTAKAEVVEIGAKKVVRDLDGHVTTEETRTWLINIGRDLPAITTEITGITTEEMRRDGIPAAQAFDEFLEFSKGLPFVGHNILRYDLPVLVANLHRLKGHEAFSDESKKYQRYAYQEERAVDTAALFKGSFLGAAGEHRHHESHKQYAYRVLETRVAGLKFNLLHCCVTLKVPTEGLAAHRAAGDVEMVDRIYRKMIGLE